MYPIATEKGLDEEGKMQYELFGVKLKELRDISSTLKSIKMSGLLDRTVIKDLIRENTIGDIIREKDVFYYWKRTGKNFSWETASFEEIKNFWINFKCLKRDVDTWKYPFVHDIWGEILDVSQRYFSGTDRQYDKIRVSSELYRYLKGLHAIGFEIHQATPSRISKSIKPIHRFYTNSNTAIARVNAMMLMLLTGETTYFTLDGEERPIIVDGFIRGKIDWKSNNSNRVYRSATPIYGEFNPLIRPTVYHDNPFIDDVAKYSYKPN